jgi:hypothetical protein
MAMQSAEISGGRLTLRGIPNRAEAEAERFPLDPADILTKRNRDGKRGPLKVVKLRREPLVLGGSLAGGIDVIADDVLGSNVAGEQVFPPAVEATHITQADTALIIDPMVPLPRDVQPLVIAHSEQVK